MGPTLFFFFEAKSFYLCLNYEQLWCVYYKYLRKIFFCIVLLYLTL